MKITTEQLKGIIREEIRNSYLKEEEPMDNPEKYAKRVLRNPAAKKVWQTLWLKKTKKDFDEKGFQNILSPEEKEKSFKNYVSAWGRKPSTIMNFVTDTFDSAKAGDKDAMDRIKSAQDNIKQASTKKSTTPTSNEPKADTTGVKVFPGVKIEPKKATSKSDKEKAKKIDKLDLTKEIPFSGSKRGKIKLFTAKNRCYTKGQNDPACKAYKMYIKKRNK